MQEHPAPAQRLAPARKMARKELCGSIRAQGALQQYLEERPPHRPRGMLPDVFADSERAEELINLTAAPHSASSYEGLCVDFNIRKYV